MIRRYEEGELSLSRLSQKLDRPVSRVIDLPADLGVRLLMEKGDIPEGYEKLGFRY